MWENMAPPWQGRVTHQADQMRPLHLSSNLDISQGHTRRQEEDNLRMSRWLFNICMLHSEAASQNHSLSLGAWWMNHIKLTLKI